MSFLACFKTELSLFYFIPSFDSLVNLKDSIPRYLFSSTSEMTKKISALADPVFFQFMTKEEYDCSLAEKLKTRGVSFLAEKHRVLEYPDIQKWIFKGGGKLRKVGVFTEDGSMKANAWDNLLRVIMSERMRKIAKTDHLSLIIPKEKFFSFPFSKKEDPFHKKYFVCSKKIEVFDPIETGQRILAFSEKKKRKLALDVCWFIEKTGFSDLHRGNLLLAKDEENLVLPDTESIGLLREISDKKPKTKISLEKASLIGLASFKQYFSCFGKPFKEEIENCQKRIRQRRTIRKVLQLTTFFFPILLLIPFFKAVKNYKKFKK